MKITITQDYTIRDICDLKKDQTLRVNHEYQRGLRWVPHQKQMFIDSILRGYSSPAFYFHKKVVGKMKNTFIDIIDGQQRVDAITSYIDGAFPLLDPKADGNFKFPNFTLEKDCPWGGKRFDELTQELQEKLLNQNLVIYEIQTDDDNEVRDLFIRLQAGTPLTPQDKRDAWPGNFTEFVLIAGGKTSEETQKWYGWDLFRERCKKTNESARRQLAAQTFMLYWNKVNEKKFCDIKSKNIDDFYHEHVGFDKDGREATGFKKICDQIASIFDGHPKLLGHHIIHLVLLVSDLNRDFSHGWEIKLPEALAEFKSRCEKGAKANKDNDKGHEFIDYYFQYAQWASSQSDVTASIQRRHIFFYEKMIELLGAKRKDPQRGFCESDREYIFYRDKKHCQYCEMKEDFSGSDSKSSHEISWEDAECHHVIPHSEGGQTIPSNGALVHKDCHPKASVDVEEFRKWWTGKKQSRSDLRERKFADIPNGAKFKVSDNQGKFRNANISGIKQDGKLMLSGEVEGVFTSPSPAAEAVTGNPINGWKFWDIQYPGSDQWIPIDIWRKDA